MKPEEIDIRKLENYIFFYKLDRICEMESFICKKIIDFFPQAVENVFKGQE